MSERPELRLVRERLERVLSPSLAGAVLFEALAAGPAPSSAAETLALVEGPLSAALAAHLAEDEARSLVEEIAAVLAPAIAQEASTEGRPPRADTTLEIPLPGPAGVTVVVLSANDQVASRLEGALGPDRVTAVAVRSAMGLRRALDASAPRVVIVDAAHFPSIEPAEVAQLLAPLPRAVLRAVWGSELPYGAVSITELARLGVAVTPLDRTEGIAPLVDLVRARS